MRFLDLLVGEKYVYPNKQQYVDYDGVWMKINPVGSTYFDYDWQAVCVKGENLGELLSHENDPSWENEDVITVEDLF